MSVAVPKQGPPGTQSPAARLWRRTLAHYPASGPRYAQLALVAAVTIVLYWQVYEIGGVSTLLFPDIGMSFSFFVTSIAIVTGMAGFASVAAGLLDRWGRANLVVIGLGLTTLLTLAVIPQCGTKWSFTIAIGIIAFLEGIVLVATPALVRDFSPQVGRGSAMALWTIGPALGSLLVTKVANVTLNTYDTWQSQYVICGLVSLVVFAVALVGLRELSPNLRNQLMVELEDRDLIEARAAAGDVAHDEGAAAFKHLLKRPRVLAIALSISIFLALYYTFVFVLPALFGTVFGWSPARSNGLGSWYWLSTAVFLVVAGVLSDRLLVRKPLMVVGAIGTAVMTVLMLRTFTDPGTGYGELRWIMIIMAAFAATAYVPWMASFTETVEDIHPSLVAVGLAVWGWIIRVTIMVLLLILPGVVGGMNTLVDRGPHVAQIVERYPQQVKVLQTVDPATLQALKANPNDQAAQGKAVSQLSGVSAADVGRVVTLSTRYKSELATAAAVPPATLKTLATDPTNRPALTTAIGAIMSKLHVTQAQAVGRLQALGKVPPADLQFLQANGAKVQRAGNQLKAVSKMPPAAISYLSANGASVASAKKDVPKQWQHWLWICAACQLAFIPFVLLMRGRWTTGAARRDIQRHEREAAAERARLTGAKV